MFTMEFHASEGGDDSRLFALDLASAVAKHSSMTLSHDGRVVTLRAAHRL